MEKPTKDLSAVAGKSKPKKLKRWHVFLCIALVALLGMSSLISFVVESASAGTTGSKGVSYVLYDSDTRYDANGHHLVDGNSAFCMQFNRSFKSGITVTKRDAVEVYGQNLTTRFALYRAYVYSLDITTDQKYFITQSLIWDTLEQNRFPGGLRFEMGLSSARQTRIKQDAIAYYEQYRYTFIGGGTFWQAPSEYQNLAEFWIARRAVGSIRLVKESSNPTVTDGNSSYSLAGAEYTIYNSSGTSVGKLTVGANGNSNTVGNLRAGEAGHYTIRETKAPPGYKLNPTVYKAHVTRDGVTVVVRAENDPILGRISLVKTSGNSSISTGNTGYRLDGAKYGVYTTLRDAQNFTNRFATITTDSAGRGSVDNIPLAQYWVREFEAPLGYWLDETIYAVDLTTSRTAIEIASTDMPKNNPVEILLSKVDVDTGSGSAGSGTATLEGAQFTVNFYNRQYASVSAAQSATPTRSWVFRTDKNGVVQFRESYKIAGDALYTDSKGNPTIPIGTLTIQETKAPTGYLLSTPTLPNKVHLFNITDNGVQGESLKVYNAPKISEQIIRGDVELVKYQEDTVTTPDLPSEQKTPEVGTTFELYASRDFSGVSPKAGAKPALSITTDRDGVAATKATGLVVTQLPNGNYSTRKRTDLDAGALPFDTYLVVQRDAPFGYSPANRFTIKVDENGVRRTYIIGNVLTACAIRIEKVDSETGKVVPFQAKWQVLNADTGKPVSMTIHYPKTQVLDTFVSSEDGWLMLPEMLPMGSYLLKEIEAPASNGLGYLINDLELPFEVSERFDWDDPLVVTFEDAPAKGRIQITKFDERTGNVLAGAKYAIYAAEDVFTLDGTLRASAGDKVDTLVTDESGKALSRELYLGSYRVEEISAPVGFALSDTSYLVDLTYKGQEAVINIEKVDVENTPTTLIIKKIDIGTGKALAGVVFSVLGEEGVFEVTTDEEGTAELPYLATGSYKVLEVSTALGYVKSIEVFEIEVDENGLIEGSAVYELVIANDFTKVEIVKTDIATAELVIGATLQILSIDESGEVGTEPLFEWTSAGEVHYLERVAQGNYILREVSAPAGYVLASDIAFSVESTGVVQRVDIENDFTKIEVVKIDSSTGKTLAGAKLQIIDEGGDVVYEWTTTDEPHVFERVAQGKYTLREVLAPDGFELGEDMPFTVEDSSDVQQVVYVNTPTPEPEGEKLDQTGGELRIPYALIGALVLLAASGMICAAKNMKCLKKNKDKVDEKCCDK